MFCARSPKEDFSGAPRFRGAAGVTPRMRDSVPTKQAARRAGQRISIFFDLALPGPGAFRRFRLEETEYSKTTARNIFFWRRLNTTICSGRKRPEVVHPSRKTTAVSRVESSRLKNLIVEFRWRNRTQMQRQSCRDSVLMAPRPSRRDGPAAALDSVMLHADALTISRLRRPRPSSAPERANGPSRTTLMAANRQSMPRGT